MTIIRSCQECGGAIDVRRADLAQFCGSKCRVIFNNRRATRGAELYDLWMALRYNRERARLLNVWTFICRIAQFYWEEDQRDRGGRPSWNDPKVVLDRRPWLKAKVFRGAA